MKRKALGVVLVFSTILAVGSSPLRAVEQVFLLISTIPGESTQPGHTNWIDGFALSHDLARPGGGSLTASEVALLKGPDRATPLLHDALARGINLPLVTIQVCGVAAGTPSRCYYKLELSGAKISSISVGESACSSDGCTPAQTESVSFSYSRIKWFYTDPAGTETSRCYDFMTGSAC